MQLEKGRMEGRKKGREGGGREDLEKMQFTLPHS